MISLQIIIIIRLIEEINNYYYQLNITRMRYGLILIISIPKIVIISVEDLYSSYDYD